ncbi:MAG: NAD(P)H-dependent glycerol-3-phosphate dehydrogenase [Rickettsiales bacterium]
MAEEHNTYRVGVIGSGSWGTAVSVIANRAGSKVVLGTRNHNVVQSINERRVNDIYLPNSYLDPKIEATEALAECCTGDLLIIAVPSQVVRWVCIAISDVLAPTIPIIILSKGVERGSLMLMSEVSEEILPNNPVGVLSGPNFADEAANGLPTATTIASPDKELLNTAMYALGGRYFRPYLTDDIIGAQIGGAVKNVIAIACGIAVGKELGENARAALVTRGFAEISRLALAKGGRYETLMGLSGLGDLILTCSSTKSRNMSFGIEIGKGQHKDDILSGRGRMATEGVIAAESVSNLARKHSVSMPICDGVYRILHENAPVDKIIGDLLERPFTSEGL